jgi:hypothetical protein
MKQGDINNHRLLNHGGTLGKPLFVTWMGLCSVPALSMWQASFVISSSN